VSFRGKVSSVTRCQRARIREYFSALIAATRYEYTAPTRFTARLYAVDRRIENGCFCLRGATDGERRVVQFMR